MTPDAGPERAPVPRHTAEIERPLSAHTDSTGTEPELDRDVEKASSHHDATFPVAGLGGEPSGVFEEDGSPRRSQSRASSARSRPLVIVPRAKRRGLFARFAVVPEVERPYDYKNSTKWGITVTIALATAAAPLGSSIFYRTFPELLSRSEYLTVYSCSSFPEY